MQIALNKLSNFCETADLIVHTGKTKVICFKKGPTLAKDEKWTFNGQNLETVRSVVYLGMSISMSGKWTQHIKKSQIKGRKAAAAASCILYKCLDPPIDLCHKLYVSHVESAALYGAEIWGVNNIDIRSSVQSGFYKRVLGLAKSASHYGILRETGTVDIKCKAQLRAVLFWLKCAKDLTSPLVAMCYREQLHTGNVWVIQPWALKIKEILNRISLSDLWVGTGLNESSVIKLVKSHMVKYSYKTTLTKCTEMTSLKLLPADTMAPPKYMQLCNRDARSGLLWFWLGLWLTYKHSVLRSGKSVTICPLCQQIETEYHLVNCPKTQKFRTKYKFIGTHALDLRNLRNCGDSRTLENAGFYFNVVRKMRNDALQKLKGKIIEEQNNCICEQVI